MFISKFRIKNYKSFYSTDDIEISTGINIITGQNNSGKTALLEMLSLKFSNKPHVSTKTKPSLQLPFANTASEIQIEFTIERQEFFDTVFTLGTLSLPPLLNYDRKNINETNLFDLYFGDKAQISAIFREGKTIKSSFVSIKNVAASNTQVMHFRVNRNEKKILFGATNEASDSSKDFVSLQLNKIYSFKAERLNVSKSPFGNSSILRPDASNLPEVINFLQGNTHRFKRFNSFVNRIFPNIHNISTIPSTDGQVLVTVWNEEPNLERGDLAVPLSDCGTGLSQALAILYVVLTSDEPNTIIIDEPNNFLHPGAARKLIEILKEHSQHQFILSTHSPSTLTASNPKTIHVVKIKDAQSSIESVDITNTYQQQIYLAEIGAKLSDVFGADNVLWVEGKTEELCFPKLIEKMGETSLSGTVILSVINTGDFIKKRDKELVFSIYEKLTKGKGLLPPAVGFVFDSEKLTKEEKQDLERRSNNSVSFLERRMFENYLINPEAIYHVIINSVSIDDLNVPKIEEWLEKKKWDKKYIDSKHSGNQKKMDWFINVDGAKLLSDLFIQITNTLLEFDKIKHSVALCEWIIENSFGELEEIQTILKEKLK